MSSEDLFRKIVTAVQSDDATGQVGTLIEEAGYPKKIADRGAEIWHRRGWEALIKHLDRHAKDVTEHQ